MKPNRKRIVTLVLVFMLLGTPSASASLLGGLRDIAAAIFEVPRSTVVGTMSGPPIVGTVVGLANGIFNTVALAGRGTLQLVGPTFAVAKRVAPILLPFVL